MLNANVRTLARDENEIESNAEFAPEMGLKLLVSGGPDEPVITDADALVVEGVGCGGCLNGVPVSLTTGYRLVWQASGFHRLWFFLIRELE